MNELSKKFEQLLEDIRCNVNDAKHYQEVAREYIEEALKTIENEMLGMASDIIALEENKKDD